MIATDNDTAGAAEPVRHFLHASTPTKNNSKFSSLRHEESVYPTNIVDSNAEKLCERIADLQRVLNAIHRCKEMVEDLPEEAARTA